jgi:hypothetical protein
MPWIDYDPNFPGVVRTPDWRFHDHLGEASIRAVEHLPTKMLFLPTCRVDDKSDLHFTTTYEGSIPDGFDIALRAQEAMRLFCAHLKTTPEEEKRRAERRNRNLKLQLFLRKYSAQAWRSFLGRASRLLLRLLDTENLCSFVADPRTCGSRRNFSIKIGVMVPFCRCVCAWSN